MAEKRSKAGLLKPLLLVVLVFGPALFLILISLNKCEHKFQTLPEYGNIGEYRFVNSDGEEITHKTQEGKITLFTTIQTSCPEKCAINLAKFNLLLYQDYRKNQKNLGHVKFVSILTDENGNPVDNLDEILFTMKDIVEGFDPDIWNIVTGDPKQVYDIESNEINLYEQRSDSAFANKPFLETLLIVDKQNTLRLVRRGDQEGLIRDFKQHVALLQKQYDKEKAKKEGE
ncbi:MAG: SCO family protein [Brumimicrobium sp.]|nr:SCO family protein [Brumimicrobium sp.]